MTAEPVDKSSGTPQRGLMQKRFTRNMSVRNKMLLSIMILMVPLVALIYIYMTAVGSTMSAASKEVVGVTLYDPMTEVSKSVSRREELVALALAKGGAAGGAAAAALPAVEAELDKQMAWLHKADAEGGIDKTHEIVAAMDRSLQALRAARPTSVRDVYSAHEQMLDLVFSYRDRVAADFNLSLDPDKATYPLIDASLAKFPEMSRALTQARVHLVATATGGKDVAGEAFGAADAFGVVDDRVSAVETDIAMAREGLAADPQHVARLAATDKDWAAQVKGWLESAQKHVSDGVLSVDDANELIAASDHLGQVIMDAQDGIQEVTSEVLLARVKAQRNSLILFSTIAGVAIIASLFMITALSMRIAGAVQRLLGISQLVASGKYDNAIDRRGGDELSQLFCGMDDMQNRLREERERERAAVERERQTVIINERVRQGLDSVDTGVMLADEKHNIIFVNKRLVQQLGAAQADIRKSLPGFDVAKLVGSNMDAFHRSPGHQRGMMEGLRGSHVVGLNFIGHVYRLTATPVLAEDGQRIGTVVEWLDRTQEEAVEKEVEGIVGAVVEGDLTRRLALEGKSGFFLNLSKGINGLVDNVAEVVTQVKTAAHEVNRGASEISTGNANLAQRTEEQASSLEETASSMEQMTSTVKQNADNAGQANQLAVAARDQADKGGAVVARAVKAMGEINSSSKKIADIISVIDEIAFQTNLLALNAAVEAARAGEQGRGFAVVASEVRSLAGRSASAAKEIKDLIQDSVRKVDEGSELVSQSGATLDQIVSAVKKVGDIVAEIAAASQEQSAGIEEVNKAVMQLDELTQQNAALVEQATAASQSMADQAQGLNDLMARYEVEGSAPASGQARRPAAAQPAAQKAERRSPNRPWSAKAKPASPPAAASRAAASSGSESEWNEF